MESGANWVWELGESGEQNCCSTLPSKVLSNSNLFGDVGICGGDDWVVPARPSEAVRKSSVLESFFTVS